MNLLTHYSELLEAGCDEAGRGCLAGPVVAGAVILKPGTDYPDLDDSKKLTEKKRMALRELVMGEALAYGIGIVTAAEIDEINILNASFLAMHRALDQLASTSRVSAYRW
jgi:Ribonuclease HII